MLMNIFKTIMNHVSGKRLKRGVSPKNLSLDDFCKRRYGLFPEDYVAAAIALPEGYNENDLQAHREAVLTWLEIAGDIIKTIAYSGDGVPSKVRLPEYVYEYFRHTWLVLRDIEEGISLDQ